MKKILLICDWDLTHLISKIWFWLEEKWYHCPSSIIVWKTYYNRLKKWIIKSPFKNLYLLQDILEIKNPEKFFDANKLLSLEKKYWIPTLWIYLWADRSYANESYEKNAWRIIKNFEYFEKIYSKEKPDLIITNAYASMAHLISFHVWSQMWIKFLNPVQLRISPKTFISNTPYETLNKEKNPDSDLINQVDKFIDKFQKDAKQWDYYVVKTWNSNSQLETSGV